MWRCEGEDVTRNCVIQQPAPSGGGGGVDLSEAGANGWSGDGTSRALAWLEGGSAGAVIIVA